MRTLALLGGVATMGSASTDIFYPALPRAAHELHVGTSAIQLTLTTFLIGLALGQIVGPISDIIGRRRPLLAGTVLYILASLGCALAPSLAVLAAARFAQGIAAAIGVVISRAIIRDLWEGADVAKHYSRLFFMLALGAIASPAIGTQVLAFTTWRGIFVALVVLGVVILVAAALGLEESLPPERRRPGSLGPTLRTFARLLHDRRFLVYAMTLACGSSTLIVLVSAAPFLVKNEYHQPLHSFSFIFSAGAATLVVVNLANARMLRHFSDRRMLLVGFLANVTCGVLLLTLGRLSVWTFALCFVALIGSWGFIAANSSALAVRDHQLTAGSAVALMGLCQYGLGGITAPAVAIAGQETLTRVGLFTLALGIAGGLGAALGVSRDRRRLLAARRRPGTARA